MHQSAGWPVVRGAEERQPPRFRGADPGPAGLGEDVQHGCTLGCWRHPVVVVSGIGGRQDEVQQSQALLRQLGLGIDAEGGPVDLGSDARARAAPLVGLGHVVVVLRRA